MRNSTKLKSLLYKYELTFSLNETDDIFQLRITDRVNKNQQQFSGASYREVLDAAYKFMNAELKMLDKQGF